MLVINSNFSYSSIYYLYLDISNFKGLLQSMNLPLTYYIPILIVAYIIGILLKHLSIGFGISWTWVANKIKRIFPFKAKLFFSKNKLVTKDIKVSAKYVKSLGKFITSSIDPNNASASNVQASVSQLETYADNIIKEATNIDTALSTTPPSTAKSSSEIILSVLKDNSDTLSDRYKLPNTTVASHGNLKEQFKNDKFLKDYARTMSRFNSNISTNPNTLTQKYIAKTNFFSSLATLFFIEFLNSVISLIVYIFYNHAPNVLTVPKITFSILLPSILLGLFCACYKEFKDHNRYQEKENYLYLLETYYKK